MIRTEISLFLKNVPGELGKLTALLAKQQINVDAMTIQDASSYVRNLFEARGKSLKKFASRASYNAVHKDSVDFALVRLLVNKPDLGVEILSENDYLFDTSEVIAIEIENLPGTLAEVTDRFGKADININYVYGSASSGDTKYLFVFSPENIELAAKIFS